jgi:hypothetical protein
LQTAKIMGAKCQSSKIVAVASHFLGTYLPSTIRYSHPTRSGEDRVNSGLSLKYSFIAHKLRNELRNICASFRRSFHDRLDFINMLQAYEQITSFKIIGYLNIIQKLALSCTLELESFGVEIEPTVISTRYPKGPF